MKTTALLAIGALICAITLGHCETKDNEESPPAGFSFVLGVKAISLSGDTTFSHNTHPDDSFLPNATVAGSAGTTTLHGSRLYFADLGLRYSLPIAPLTKQLVWRIELGGLGGGNDDTRQNANDSRPAEIGAFVYTAANWGVYASSGLVYYLGKHFYFGADAEYDGVFVDSGWDRWGSRESQKTDLKSFFGACPVIGIDLNESFGIEAGARFGTGSPSYEFKLIYRP